MKIYQDNSATIYCGDALTILRELPNDSIQCCITSPPYWGLRDYGIEGQLGLEKTPEEYVAKLVEIFREVRRVTRDDGTLWLNLGDSYTDGSTAKRQQSKNPGVGANRPEAQGNGMRRPPIDGLLPKNLVGIPWRVAFALQADGWYLRSDIIWAKPNPMPESVTDRPTKSHEYVFLFSKSQKYYYDADAIKEPVAESTINRGPVGFGGEKGRNYKPEKNDPNYRGGNEQWGRTFDYSKSCVKKFGKEMGGGGTSFVGHSGYFKADGTPIGIPGWRNKRSVWVVTTKPYSEAHFATFPPDLIKPMILAGCPTGGTVLDPFLGSGTTAYVSKELGRCCIGIELNLKYTKLAEKRLMQEVINFNQDARSEIKETGEHLTTAAAQNAVEK
jgi:DNA modification methylase